MRLKLSFQFRAWVARDLKPTTAYSSGKYYSSLTLATAFSRANVLASKNGLFKSVLRVGNWDQGVAIAIQNSSLVTKPFISVVSRATSLRRIRTKHLVRMRRRLVGDLPFSKSPAGWSSRLLWCLVVRNLYTGTRTCTFQLLTSNLCLATNSCSLVASWRFWKKSYNCRWWYTFVESWSCRFSLVSYCSSGSVSVAWNTPSTSWRSLGRLSTWAFPRAPWSRLSSTPR